ncbi:MAG: hypothetical protein HW414_602 [Dehalococcoidia bacterium]|nr:hypothetical protein [Dehalococcoidia bacterium]
MSLKTIKRFFLVAALYDIILGIVFGFLFKPVYIVFGAELPNHDGYIQLIAFYVLTFGICFYLAYRNPQLNRQFAILGVLMKISFATVVFGHFIADTIPLPQVFITLAVIDLLFIPFFIAAYSSLRKMATTNPPK